MTVNPVPSVAITQLDGTALTFTPATPALTVNGLPVLLLDDLTATWGRVGYLDHHDPQTAKFTVLWPQGFGSNSTTGRVNWDDWMGQPVVMSWTDPVSHTTRTFFRGHVSDVVLRPRDPDAEVPAGRAPRPRGAFVDVVAMGTLADVANRTTATESWPEESGDARMNRLRALTSGVVAGIDYRPYWGGATMAARSVNGASVLDLLRSMYDTAGGDRLGYDPQTNRINYRRRRSIQSPSAAVPAGSNWRARLRNDPALYPGGVHISAHSGGSLPWPMLDARWIEGGRNYARSVTSKVTRIVTHWSESNGTVAASSLLVDLVTEATAGVRAMDLQTELRDSGWAAVCQSDWWGILQGEGRNPAPDPMVYRADLAGGFDTLAAAQLLIGGVEMADETNPDFQGNGNLVFIAGDIHQAMWLSSIYSIIGGEIRYLKGGWRATINTVRAAWESTTGINPRVRVSELRANATKDRFLLKDLAKTITWNDLRSVSSW